MSATPRRREAHIGRVILFGALATLSAFAIDTYVPALGAVQRDLAATPAQVQQTLSAYMFGLALMALWHGAIADATGRRPVMLAGVAIYAVAAAGCALTADVHVLIALRFIQGLAGGVGMIIVRAMVRDTLEGAEAQRMLSSVMMLFSIAPAIAPVIGGYLFVWFGWRSVFWFMCAGGALLFMWSYIALAETLPADQRQSLNPLHLARNYMRVYRSATFWGPTAAAALSFQGFFQYIGAAHPFVVEQLGLAETQFVVLFAPIVTGFMLGSALSGRVAGRWSVRRTASVAFTLMFAAAIFNVLYHTFAPPHPVPSIAPIFVGAIGMSLFAPVAQLLVLDMFPATRGLTASCQAFAQLLLSAVCMGVVSLALSVSTLALAAGQLLWTTSGIIGWLIYLAADRHRRRGPPQSA